MPTLNEVKEQMVTVRSVGEFTNAMQQIATMRMVQLRMRVQRSRPFIEAATTMLRELASIQKQMDIENLTKEATKKDIDVGALTGKRAVVVVTSNAGLIGPYNQEIYKRVEKLLIEEKDADFFVIGKKGQEYFGNGKFPVSAFPYELKDNFTLEDLSRLVRSFDSYGNVILVYSHFVNSATREVVAVSVVQPIPEEAPDSKDQPGRFTFEPELNKLVDGVSKKLRAALFQQQVFDARLSQFSAQMIGMKAATDNSVTLLKDLQFEYNKQRRKMIDKKIGEVFAGSALW